MKIKQLGSTQLHIPPVVFGGNVFGWTLDEKESFRMLDEVIDKGFTAIDTADSYSHWAPGNKGGESETILGKWLKERGNRDKIVLATKVGSNPGKEGRDVSKNYILKAAEDSLRRLQTDHIDLYFTHWDNEATPVEETLEAYDQLIKEGKVRYIGASNLSPERIRESMAASEENGLARYKVLQPEYSLMERKKFEDGYWELAKEYDLGVISYFSLASGFLTGKYRKAEDIEGSRKQIVEKYFSDKGLNILHTLDKIAERHGVSDTAVALKWIMLRPGISAPIVSATKSSHLKAFEEAVELKLSGEEMERLNEVSR
ncbi:Predicted oxidoreductase [Salinimicrobium catena]|uniref:Predicted oxidoreductase n=1 Tax=Salinimicrobium catena TaxID=390640 RepID=A0A1H5P7F8_9FLAO|nr:aldo/keto reductase [Salinimicrobium catena]SDL75634.1 Predicted oxidoreductase [Salinimicrobium catena]SEF09883.1 Predicted oxidoreductase [Salinimicrobium catena]